MKFNIKRIGISAHASPVYKVKKSGVLSKKIKDVNLFFTIDLEIYEKLFVGSVYGFEFGDMMVVSTDTSSERPVSSLRSTNTLSNANGLSVSIGENAINGVLRYTAYKEGIHIDEK